MEVISMNIANIPDITVRENIPYNKNSTQNKPSSESKTPKNNIDRDTIYISSEAQILLDEKKALKEHKEQSPIDEARQKHLEEAHFIEEMKRDLERIAQAAENNPYENMIKCMKIAMRIIAGDEVPNRDKRFLAENEPAMFSRAILLRKHKDKPKKYDSLLEDKKNDSIDSDMESPISFKESSDAQSGEFNLDNNTEVSTDD